MRGSRKILTNQFNQTIEFISDVVCKINLSLALVLGIKRYPWGLRVDGPKNNFFNRNSNKHFLFPKKFCEGSPYHVFEHGIMAYP